MGSLFHMMTPPIPGDNFKNALGFHSRCCFDPKEINEEARSALPPEVRSCLSLAEIHCQDKLRTS